MNSYPTVIFSYHFTHGHGYSTTGAKCPKLSVWEVWVGKEKGLKAKEGSSLSVLGERWFLEDWPKARQRV